MPSIRPVKVIVYKEKDIFYYSTGNDENEKSLALVGYIKMLNNIV